MSLHYASVCFVHQNWKVCKDIFINIQIFVQMVAKGKDASDLFPAVVKNVVSKNTEVLNSLILHYKFFLSFLCSILEFCR